MISHLNGNVLRLTAQQVTINFSSIGIAFDVFVPNAAVITVGSQVNLFIYMHWNAENGPSLYGFQTMQEKQIFEMVISCSGIGPKIGLAVLEQMQPGDFIKALANQDVKALSSVNGIGAKKAEQIIVHLKHKVMPLLETGFVVENNNIKHFKNISDVLESLNYSKHEIFNAIEHLKNNNLQNDYTFDQMLRSALSFLSKRI